MSLEGLERELKELSAKCDDLRQRHGELRKIYDTLTEDGRKLFDEIGLELMKLEAKRAKMQAEYGNFR